MRTTINIADDIFFAAKDFARRDQKTLGEVFTDWARAVLNAKPMLNAAPGASTNKKLTKADRVYRDLGFRPFDDGVAVVTNQHINALREQEGI